MPVDDIEVHHKVKHTTVKPGCYDRHPAPDGIHHYHTFTGEVVLVDTLTGCRQIGRKYGSDWGALPECLGCLTAKDMAYITKARVDIDTESAKFMKAVQG